MKRPILGDLGFKVLYLHFFCDDRQFFIFCRLVQFLQRTSHTYIYIGIKIVSSCQLIFNSLFHLAFCNHHILTEVLNHKPCHNIVLQWKNFALHLDRFRMKHLSYYNPQHFHYHKLFGIAGLLFGNFVLHLDRFCIKALS